MNQLIGLYNYTKLYIETTLHKIFRDDGRRYMGDYKYEPKDI